MGRLLLDSTVIIDALRGRPAAQRLRALRRTGEELWSCAICVEEIWRGCRPGEEPTIARMFRGLRIAPLGVEQGALAGRWRREHSDVGVTLHQADCLIAAAAAGVSARLATGNPADFPMDGLVVELWPVGT